MALSRAIAERLVEKNIPIDVLEGVLRKYRLLNLLPLIRKDMRKLYSKDAKRETILIESPFEMNSDALGRIKRIVGNDLAPTEITINKDILAGFKARYKGKLYDGSAERIIKKLISS